MVSHENLEKASAPHHSQLRYLDRKKPNEMDTPWIVHNLIMQVTTKEKFSTSLRCKTDDDAN
jgi:hypothetical protein